MPPSADAEKSISPRVTYFITSRSCKSCWRERTPSIGPIGCALELHPLLHRRSLPLRFDESAESRRNFMTVPRQALQHEREIAVGDAPASKKRCAPLRHKTKGDLEETCGCRSPSGRERLVGGAVEHRRRRPLLAQRQEVGTNPMHDHASARAISHVVGERTSILRGEEDLVEIVDDRRRLAEPEAVVIDGGHATELGAFEILRTVLLLIRQRYRRQCVGDALLLEGDEDRESVGTNEKAIRIERERHGYHLARCGLLRDINLRPTDKPFRRIRRARGRPARGR